MKKILNWSLVAIVSFGGLAACGSDKKSTSTTKAPATEATAGSDTGDSTSSGDANTATVEKFCKDVTDLVAKGPSASDYASKLTELTGQGASLGAAVAADPSLQTKLSDCLKKLVPGG